MENAMYLTKLKRRITVVTRPQAGWSRVQIPLQEIFFSSQNIQTSSGAHPANYSMGVRFLSRGDVDYPPPSTAKWGMSAAVLLTPNMYIYIYIYMPSRMQRENLTCLLPFYFYVPCGGFGLGRFGSWKRVLTVWKTFTMQW